jgi:phosphatidylglycerol---prolipoprotein diacylglyceryl transferase
MYGEFPGVTWAAPWGAMMVFAGLAAWLLARRRASANGIDPSHIDLALPLAFILGASLAGILASSLASEHWLAGDVLAGATRRRLYAVAAIMLPALYVYSRVAGLSFRRLADTMATPALVFMALGRIGCLLAGCCFGGLSGNPELLANLVDPALQRQLATVPALAAVELPWAVRFPVGSFAHAQHVSLGLVSPDAPASLPVHPVQLYETLLVLALWLAIVKLRGRRPRPGKEALVVLAGYAGLQFTLEFLRGDNLLVMGLLTMNQVLGLGALVLATGMFVFHCYHPRP